MSEVNKRTGKSPLSRRDFLQLASAAVGGAVLGSFISPLKYVDARANLNPTPQPTPTVDLLNKQELNSTSYKDFFNGIMTQAEKVGGIWAHPEASMLLRPGFAPYLPATESEVISHAKDVESKTENKGIGWGQAVFPRAIVLPSDHPQDHVRDTYKAVKTLGEKRGWGDITAWEGAWVYSMTLMGGLKDLQANRQVKVMSNGKMVEIDPVREDNDAIAINVIDRGNPKMAVYVVPQNGEIHARLPQDTTESNVTMGFAVNKHHADIKLDASGDDVPAIIVRGVATAPVTISYCVPIDDQGNFKTLITQTRLEPLTGNVTVDMNFPAEDYKGDISPFIVVNMPVVATNTKGETEVMFVPGSDVKPGNPKYAEKHRVTVDMLKAGQPL